MYGRGVRQRQLILWLTVAQGSKQGVSTILPCVTVSRKGQDTDTPEATRIVGSYTDEGAIFGNQARPS